MKVNALYTHKQSLYVFPLFVEILAKRGNLIEIKLLLFAFCDPFYCKQKIKSSEMDMILIKHML